MEIITVSSENCTRVQSQDLSTEDCGSGLKVEEPYSYSSLLKG